LIAQQLCVSGKAIGFIIADLACTAATILHESASEYGDCR
jgi:hypothetical protein